MVNTEDTHQWTRKKDKMMALVFETFGLHSSFSLFWLLHLLMPTCPYHLLVAWHHYFLVGRGSSSWSSTVEDGEGEGFNRKLAVNPFSHKVKSLAYVRKLFVLYGHRTFPHCKEIPNRHSQGINLLGLAAPDPKQKVFWICCWCKEGIIGDPSAADVKK